MEGTPCIRPFHICADDGAAGAGGSHKRRQLPMTFSADDGGRLRAKSPR